jgi:hypothetical protein
MTFDDFRRISPVVQLYCYHCASDGRGVFTEAGIDNGRGQAVLLYSFVSSELLEGYVHGVRLPKILRR